MKDLLSIFTFAVAAAAGVNSFRKTKSETDGATNQALQALNTKYLQEIQRLETKIDDAEKECRELVAGLNQQLRSAQRTILTQAERITELEHRQNKNTRTRLGDGD